MYKPPGTPWLTAIGTKLHFDFGAVIKSGLSTILVLALGAGGFAGSWVVMGAKRIEVDPVSLDSETAQTVARAFVEAHERHPHALNPVENERVVQLEIAYTIQAAAIASAGETLDKIERLTLDNTRLVNRLLGRLDLLAGDVGEVLDAFPNGGS